MKTLIIGFIVFAAWATMSTYIYVCKVKDLCKEPQSTLVAETKSEKTVSKEQLTSGKVSIPDDLVIYFAFDKSDFIPGARTVEYFTESNEFLKNNQQAILSITGHTDNVGTIKYNQDLGLRRAQTLHRYFINKGISTTRISIESKGESEPAADNKSAEGRSKNRRSEVTIKQ